MSKKLTKITKISETENPLVKSATKEEYKYGTYNNNVSIPIDYWVVGYLFDEIKVGKPVRLFRKIRNGEKVEGIFTTSKIQTWDGNIFTTMNSKYKVEDYNEPIEG